jgi:hypothetical protein
VDKRIRSPNYPALSLPVAVEKVSAVYREINRHAGPREVIAKAMGYSSLNGASASAISALQKFGLLERIGEEIKVSERALRVLHPHSAEERARAIEEAASDPSLFAELKGHFPGKHPNDDLVRNYLARKGFAPAALTAVTAAYRETSEMVARELEGHTPTAGQHAEEIATVSHSQPISTTPPPASIAPQLGSLPSNERPIGRYDFEGGAYVRIAAFGEVDTEEALDMVETLIALKRNELKRANRRSTSQNSDDVSESGGDS